MTEDWDYKDDSFNLQDFLLKNIFNVVLITIGILLFGLGVYLVSNNQNDDPGVEIIEGSAEKANGSLLVEVNGAVNAPGVYELPIDARVEDALVAASGLSDSADNEWMAKTINRASNLTDGQKIYVKSIDEQSEEATAKNTGGDQTMSTTILGETEQKVNINTASASELENLWGIGPVTAESIIVHRPYSTLEDLLTKKILKSNVYERNKDLMSVY